MFNILTDTLPTEYGGVSVRTDFKQALKFFKAYDSTELTDNEKAIILTKILFEGRPPNDPKIWDFIQFYLSGGEEKNNNGGSEEKTFCFIQDAGLIYSAFRQVYNINLVKEKMHWWEFLELFKALPDNTQFAKVIELRTSEIPKDMKMDKKVKLMNAKARFALKTNKTFSLKDFF